MAGLLLFLFLFLTTFCNPSSAHFRSSEEGFISAVISEKGLDFVKNLLIEQAVRSLTPLRLPDIEETANIPLIGGVHMVASNVTLYGIDVNSSTVQAGESGIAIVASGATVNLSMDWSYSYSISFLPIKISDQGSASIEVEGMEVGLTMSMKNHNGTLDLSVLECGCYMRDLIINLNGGASWFYQGFVNAFGNHIRSAVENAITDKISEGTAKLDYLLQSLPKEIDVDNVVALNVTFVNDPLFGSSSVEFDINGLFTLSDIVSHSIYWHKYPYLLSSVGLASRMLWISLDEAVFNSASVAYFQAGLMHWIVDRVPDQSLLNTASWKFIIPQLYRQYPNDDMQLNILLTSSPILKIRAGNIGATIFLDMTVNVLDDTETVPVACVSVAVTVSGTVEISGNNLAGRAELDDFSLSLKWSNVGNFHMSLIQGVMHIFLNSVFMPYLNSHLLRGFPLPIIHGFTLQDAYILVSNSRIMVSSNVAFTNSISVMHDYLQNSHHEQRNVT
ncbi:putative BPI/LBP family protein At1g04970 [Typha angustifolia]|uniref:putative BPI/LBP family protein At1g04970 n=1 Tax=Typha angustifolia TaxID=59011 RepID=UPI003C2B3C9C